MSARGRSSGSKGRGRGERGAGPVTAAPARKIAVELPPALTTRSKNRDSHPGSVVVNAQQRRRTTAEVQAAREAEEQRAADEEAEKQRRLKKVADIEDGLDQEDVQRDKDAFTGPQESRILRARAAVVQKGMVVDVFLDDRTNGLEDKDVTMSAGDEESDSGSGDDYEEASAVERLASDGEESDELKDDVVAENSSVHGNLPASKANTAGKAKKMGKAKKGRDDVHLHREMISVDAPTAAPDAGKRKADAAVGENQE
ncbi:hypothetical protein BD626DRAFT_573964 [Schizophyllum amplum]|uniref:Uncharacterized protein n=1 Tax=Schizophyllum amplum TaxID=97359 RepID=A0A550BZK3_9AGAR|nr:hypothetical protein BD626DRAFT_573964 [Auriculariopsis ampla]